jgi:hypothetical protein
MCPWSLPWQRLCPVQLSRNKSRKKKKKLNLVNSTHLESKNHERFGASAHEDTTKWTRSRFFVVGVRSLAYNCSLSGGK